ncbi:MAG TPA: carboxymuconolactone decarboxylase family protein [Pseudolabrys sp.]|nr:carboxymuconolactone decarboxylase family protein [Pseudolabrys sp.]HVU21888.1 carboxymuconolactone decarboxylase family protein [Rhizomicrobium sp.]
MNRLIEPSTIELTQEQSAILDRLVAGRGRILGPYKIWIHSPAVASGMEQLGTFLNKSSSLSPREVELCILLIASHWNADYVRRVHERTAKKLGFTDEFINALATRPRPMLADPHENCVYQFASALIAGEKLSDAEFKATETVIGRSGIAEVLVLLGYYTSVALGMKSHDVPVPE